MTPNTKRHIIYSHQSVRDAFIQMEEMKKDPILIVADENLKLLGSLTDGDLRRGFIKGLTIINHTLLDFVQPDPLFIYEDELSKTDINALRKRNILVIPIINRDGYITDVLNLTQVQSLLPVDVVIMAGGRGQRLMPLTENTPKPMLPVGEKPILEHNIDRLTKFGIKNICISVNYLADKIESYFGDGSSKGISINYVYEDKPMGTMGSVKLCNQEEHDHLLVMNSDLLTTIDYDAFYREFINTGADMAVATTSYTVEVPYGVLEVDNGNYVNSLKEKPRYTYYSNAGIYLIKRELLSLIPDSEFYNVTDMMDAIIKYGKKLVSFPIHGYWLDIGKHEDYKKAQEDVKFLNL
ncbi:MAG: nucleotidyltransferase family protein [Bacteroidetes bacterium]|nr:nucleotidyltransferase family protein [Bacteroidota bacterium]